MSKNYLLSATRSTVPSQTAGNSLQWSLRSVDFVWKCDKKNDFFRNNWVFSHDPLIVRCKSTVVCKAFHFLNQIFTFSVDIFIFFCGLKFFSFFKLKRAFFNQTFNVLKRKFYFLLRNVDFLSGISKLHSKVCKISSLIEKKYENCRDLHDSRRMKSIVTVEFFVETTRNEHFSPSAQNLHSFDAN